MAKTVDTPTPSIEGKSEFKMVGLTAIKPSSTNPRKTFDEELIKELAESIKQHGIIQPLLVRPFPVGDVYELVAGERRYRAALGAGLEFAPCYIRELSDEEALECQIVENLQRKDVHPMDEAVAFKSLIEERDIPIADVAKKIGKPIQYVSRRYWLNMLIPDAMTAFFKDQLNLGHALEISRLKEADQKTVLEYAEGDDFELSISDLKGFIQNNITRNLSNACFKTNDTTLVEGKPACEKCPLRSGYSKTLFNDIEEDDRCFDGDCFNKKSAAFITRQFEKEAKKQPLKIAVRYKYGQVNDIIDLLPDAIKKTLITGVHPFELKTSSKACSSCDAIMSLTDEVGKVRFKCCVNKCPSKSVENNNPQNSSDSKPLPVLKIEEQLKNTDELIEREIAAALRDNFAPLSLLDSDKDLPEFSDENKNEIRYLEALMIAHIVSDETLGAFALRLNIPLAEDEYTPADEDDSAWFDLNHETILALCGKVIINDNIWMLFKAIGAFIYFRNNYGAHYNAKKFNPIKLQAAKILGFNMDEKISEIKSAHEKKKSKLQADLNKLISEKGASNE